MLFTTNRKIEMRHSEAGIVIGMCVVNHMLILKFHEFIIKFSQGTLCLPFC